MRFSRFFGRWGPPMSRPGLVSAICRTSKTLSPNGPLDDWKRYASQRHLPSSQHRSHAPCLRHTPPGMTLGTCRAHSGMQGNMVWYMLERDRPSLSVCACTALTICMYQSIRKCVCQVVPLLDPLGLDLLKSMLCYEPQRRISARQALMHPYFKDIDDLYSLKLQL